MAVDPTSTGSFTIDGTILDAPPVGDTRDYNRGVVSNSLRSGNVVLNKPFTSTLTKSYTFIVSSSQKEALKTTFLNLVGQPVSITDHLGVTYNALILNPDAVFKTLTELKFDCADYVPADANADQILSEWEVTLTLQEVI